MTNLVTWWLCQKLMVGFGCDIFPILQYNHNTWIWVGLNWKFMYLSMGSLLDKCHRGYAKNCLRFKIISNERVTLTAYAVPGLAVCQDWEATLIGEVPILGYVIERFRLIIRIPSMIIQGCPWRMYQMLWWKCTPSAECKTIRIAASAVMDGWMAILFRHQMFSNFWNMTWTVWRWLESQQSCGNDTNVPAWVTLARYESFTDKC